MTHPLRVAIVTESFLPSINGVARSVARVVEHLERRGHQAVVITPGDGPEHHGNTSVVRLPSLALPMARTFPIGIPTPLLRATLRDVAPDVVHLASPIAVGAHGATVARDLGLPTVAVFQTDVAGFATQYRGLTVTAPTVWRWLRHVHAKVDRTLAPSRPVAAELARHGIERVHRWGRGVDLDDFHPAARTRPPTHDVPVVRVGYVGRLAREKRIERLAVLADLPGIELVVVGDGDRRRWLEQRLPTATFTGMLTGAALYRAYADLDVFVHTGTHETFCQAVQEALSSGVPAVAPASGGPLDLVQHGTNGVLWDPLDPASIRDAVAELARDPALRAGMGTHARHGVLDRSWAAIGDEMLGHYRDVMGGAVAPVAQLRSA